MIELTAEQAQAMAQQKAPLKVVNPLTQEVFVLIRQNIYESTCGILSSMNRHLEQHEPELG